MAEFITRGPAEAAVHLLLAHGAGAPADSPFMEQISERLAACGIHVLRFDFAYMAARRTSGTRKPPPKAERLMPEFLEAVQAASATIGPAHRLFIGGKSMGGRVASFVADELYAQGTIAGLVCLGYPFHPPKKPDRLRTKHLVDLTCPMLIVQGERDAFGSRTEVEGYRLAKSIKLHWIGNGDHDLAPRRGGRAAHLQALDETARAVAVFFQGRSAR